MHIRTGITRTSSKGGIVSDQEDSRNEPTRRVCYAEEVEAGDERLPGIMCRQSIRSHLDVASGKARIQTSGKEEKVRESKE